MIKFCIKFFAVSGAMLLASYFIEGITIEQWWPTAIIAAALLALLNITLKPILHILTLPINLLTLGLFSFIINALIFWILTFVDGVTIESFLPALLGSLIVTVIKWLVDLIFD